MNDFTLTYNLHTGEQMHWAAYLKKGEAEEIETNPGNMQPVWIYAVKSQALQRFYSAGWNDQGDCRIYNVVDPDGEELTSFYLSPTPQRVGLSVLPANLPGPAAQCSTPVVLGKDAMQSLGLSEGLQNELLSARARPPH